MIDDYDEEQIRLLREIRDAVGGGRGAGTGAEVGVQQGGVGVEQGGVGVETGGVGVETGGTAVETNVVVPEDSQHPPFERSLVYTTGEEGATIFNEDFTSDGEFVFGFPSRILYIRTDTDIVAEFRRDSPGVEHIPIPADIGEMTLGDGGEGFRADKVRLKLADSAEADEANVHLIAYR